MQILFDIKWFKLQGFPDLVDIGDANPQHTQGMFTKHHSFFVLQKFGVTVYDIYDLNDSYLKIPDLLKLGLELIKRIEALHGIGYIHRDLKPDNFLLDKNVDVGQIKPAKASLIKYSERLDLMLRQSRINSE
jgi:serine/threonine protein kinase